MDRTNEQATSPRMPAPAEARPRSAGSFGVGAADARGRAAAERRAVDEALRGLAGSLTGEGGAPEPPRQEQLQSAINEVLRFLNRRPVDFGDAEDPVGFLSDRFGIESRSVELVPGWYRDAVGPYLAELDDGHAVALLPRRGGYAYRSPADGRWVRVGEGTAAHILPDAVCLYVPLPARALTARDLLAFLARTLSGGDVALMVVATLGVTLAGMLTPAVTKLAFAGVVPSGAFGLVGILAVLLCGAAVASGIIGVVKSFALATIKVRASAAVQAAVMGRVMAMPAGFFRRLAPGDIVSRLGVADKLAASVLDAAFGLGLTGVLSLLYVFQIVRFAPVLVLPALLVLAAQACVSAVAVFQKTKRLQREMRASSELSGFMLALLGGMQKVRLTGAEMRMLAAWARRYQNVTELRYHLPKLLLWYSVLNAFIGALGTAVLYLVAAAAEVPYADFVAFSSAYGMVCAGFGPLLGIVNVVAQFKPMLDMLEPILGYAPEAEEGKPMPAPLSGAIVLDHVSFGYPQETPGGEEARGPAVIDDLSLEIAPGEYVGICGTSGCGKSTLMRLMLGFERPWSGQVSFDGQALDAVNLRALRRQIGTVQQNARLMAGSIFQNISVCAPGLTEEQAWEAAEAACLADDIRAMPMKMNTMVSEGGGGLSGGQRQRLLIARALAAKPRIVFMDEATSALDNVAQAQVARSLDALRCTRVVIAHRLSTIRNCDRIVVLDAGRIVEDGTYEELVERGGRFAELVRRQRLDAR